MLATKPTRPDNGEPLDEDFIQALLDILEIFGYTIGSGGAGQGSIQDDNIADDAAIRKSKVADNAVVCTDTVDSGVQTISRDTMFTAGALKLDPLDLETIAQGGGGTTLAFTTRKRFKRVTYNNAAPSANTDITMVGAVEGDIITIIAGDVQGGGALSVGNTAGGGANKINCRDGAGASISTAETNGVLGTFIYAKFGEAAAQWWEI